MKSTLLFGITATIILTTACNPVYYSPNSHHVPILKQKGDVRAGAFLSERTKQGNAAYALTDHLGIMVAGAKYKRKPNGETGDNASYGSGRLLEMGLGGFNHIDKHFQIELYGLVGNGRVFNALPYTRVESPETGGFIYARFVRLGVQSAISYTGKFVDVSFATRFLHLNYYQASGSLIHEGIDQVAYIRAHRYHKLIEPSLTVRFGCDPLKFFVQVATSSNHSYREFYQDKGIVSIGMTTAFNSNWKKKP
jgi:hypothetical protein